MGKASKRKAERRAGIGGYKVSDALYELVEPFKYGDFGLAEYKKLVTLGAAAWNIAVLPEPNASEALKKLIHELCPSASGTADSALARENEAHEFETLVRDLIKRKTELFPRDRRLILQVEITKRGDKCHITVGSTRLRTRQA